MQNRFLSKIFKSDNTLSLLNILFFAQNTMKSDFILTYSQLLPKFQRLQCLKICILDPKNVKMAYFGIVRPILTLLCKLTPSISQVIKGGDGNNIFDLAIFCKMFYFITIKTLNRARVNFLD